MPNLCERLQSEHDHDAVKKMAVLFTLVCMELGVKVKEVAQVASEVVGKSERTV